MGRVPDRDDDAVQLLLRQHLAYVGIGPLHIEVAGPLCPNTSARTSAKADEVGVRIGLQRGDMGGCRPPSGSDDGDSGCVLAWFGL